MPLERPEDNPITTHSDYNRDPNSFTFSMLSYYAKLTKNIGELIAQAKDEGENKLIIEFLESKRVQALKRFRGFRAQLCD